MQVRYRPPRSSCSTKVLLGHFLFVNLCTEIRNINTVIEQFIQVFSSKSESDQNSLLVKRQNDNTSQLMKWINTLLNSENVVMHLEA